MGLVKHVAKMERGSLQTRVHSKISICDAASTIEREPALLNAFITGCSSIYQKLPGRTDAIVAPGELLSRFPAAKWP